MSMRRYWPSIACLLTLACGGSSPNAPSPVPSAPSTPAPLPTQPAPIVRGPLFDQTFWNCFVHNTCDQPGALVPLQRLTAAPNVYLRTIDDAGNVIDAVTLNATAQAMRDVAAQWTGGRFGILGVTQGTSSMEGIAGWLTVKWDAASTTFCGRSSVGVDGGALELAPHTPGCSCPGSVSTVAIRPRTVKHELGHAFGYWHTGNAADLMSGLAVAACDQDPSDRERYHADIAYQTPIGTTTALSVSSRVITD